MPFSLTRLLTLLLIGLLTSSVAAEHSTSLPELTDAQQAYFNRLVKKIEPDAVGKPEKIDQYLQFYQREMINDLRLFAYDVQARWTDNQTLRLTGDIEFQESHNSLLHFLHRLGFINIDDQIHMLPSADLGEKRYGFLTVSHAISFDRPDGKQTNVTELLLGDPIYLLKSAANDHILCHSAEGYLGYLPAKAIHRVTAEEFTAYRTARQVNILQDVTTPDDLLIPAGARLEFVGQKNSQIICQLPNGKKVTLTAKQCEIAPENTKERLERIIKTAHNLIGTKYLWGGKTSAGIDCSGLVQVAFGAEGLNLPRDSNQQVYLGTLTATRWHRAAMQRGDTLYFLGHHGKIVHTAIYLGDDQYLEASSYPGVRISSLNPAHKNFDAKRINYFAFAKRLLD